MKRSSIHRKTPLRRSTKPMRKVSAKAWWPALRAKAKVAFARVGVTVCELRMPGCWRDNGLGFAHSVRRRFITTEELKREICVACNHCHLLLDTMPHDETASVVRRVIAARAVQIIIP